MKDCHIKEGDTVKVQEFWGKEYLGKHGKVLSIHQQNGCSSGYMVYTDFTKNPMDSGWFIKIDNNEKDRHGAGA